MEEKNIENQIQRPYSQERPSFVGKEEGSKTQYIERLEKKENEKRAFWKDKARVIFKEHKD